MVVRWTTLASNDLSRITRRVRQDNPAAARKVAKTLYDSGMSLQTMLNRGRNGRIAGTRE
jgi:plasmid stabilization system protein ParE